MAQVLIVLNDKELSSILRVKLAEKYGIEVIERHSSSEAISLLQILPGIEIVLCKDIIQEDPVATKVCDFLAAQQEEDSREINIMVVGESVPNHPKAVWIGRNPSHQKISNFVGFLLGREKKDDFVEDNGSEKEGDDKTTVFQFPDAKKKTSISDYCPMNIIYFMNFPEVIIDFSVYSRIKKADGFEYNKKFSYSSKITRSEMERVLIRSGKDLYIPRDESKIASDFLNRLFLARFKAPELTWSDRMKLNSDSFEILLDLFKNSAFDKYNVEIIKELILSIDILVKAPDALPVFLAGLKLQKLSYGYTHSFLTFYLFMEIIDHFSWSKDQSKNKLLYLCLFHDLSLHSDRLIKLHHNYMQESKNLTDEEKQIMSVHAEACASTLEGIIKAPRELIVLIKEHHGLKSGKGFIETLSMAITPANMAFIVIEDFVTHYLVALEKAEGDKAAGPSKTHLDLIFTELKKKYDRLTYADVLAQLQKFITRR